MTTRFAVSIDDDRFLALLDSESYATNNAAYQPGAETLCTKLDRDTPASDTTYDGHFGAAIFFDLDTDDISPETFAAIEAVINQHLDWCQTLEVVEHVRKRRAKEKAE